MRLNKLFALLSTSPLALLYAIWALLVGACSPATAQLFSSPQLSTPSVLTPSQAPGDVMQTPQVRAQLWAHAPHGVVAGETFWLGLSLTHQPHWHTYWRNPGDSGLPTQLRWNLPQGLNAQTILWPKPQKIAIGSLTNYGYENQALLVVPVKVASSFQSPSPINVRLTAQWLVCRQECIPQEGSLALTLPPLGASAAHASEFEAAFKAQPKALPHAQAATATLSENATQLKLKVSGLPSAWQGHRLTLLPITPEIVVNSAPQTAQGWQGQDWTLQLPISDDRLDSPSQLQWLLSLEGPLSATPESFEFTSAVRGTWPSREGAPVPAQLTQALQAKPTQAASSISSPLTVAASTLEPARMAMTLWLGALLGAFLGGLLLNLMPCVFPVLAIKVIGFAKPGHTRSEHRSAGWAYTAGVILSFSLLGGLMLVLRAGGAQLGWGFQLQSPVVVAGLALLFTLLGLNLSGWFEIGQFVPSRLAALQHRHPGVDAAWSGVLAVVVASPCTAPFMGASLGLAIGLPAWQALPIFMAMGLGLALPYLSASLWPAVGKALPRPGPWMIVMRHLLAFPMFATVIWLLWVLGQQVGIDGAMALLSLLLAISFCVWAWGLKGKVRWALVVLGLGLSLWLANLVRVQLQFTPSFATDSPPSSSNEPASNRPWQAWSAARVQSRLDAGDSVFVDFTAAWCVTCQFNKKTTLSDPGLMQTFEVRHVALLRADWTRQDPTITQALNGLGRSGVPLYVIYKPGRPPQLLSELPSVAEIEEALRQ